MPREELRIVGGAYDALHRVLHAWCDLQAKYAAIENEPAYDNSEAANTSLLIAAANSLYGWTGISEMWVERLPKGQHQKDATDTKLGRGLLDAYLATETAGHLLELKQAWMLPKLGKEDALKYEGVNPLIAAQQQLQQLDHQGSFSKGQEFTSYYGAFLVPSFDKTKTPMKRKKVFAAMNTFCCDNFESYAIIAPNLKDRDLTRVGRGLYRPLVAIGLRVHLNKDRR